MMKNFYSFLKGLMAAMLLCLGVLAPNAANAANGIQGVQGVSAYTADDLVGLWTAAIGRLRAPRTILQQRRCRSNSSRRVMPSN